VGFARALDRGLGRDRRLRESPVDYRRRRRTHTRLERRRAHGRAP